MAKNNDDSKAVEAAEMRAGVQQDTAKATLTYPGLLARKNSVEWRDHARDSTLVLFDLRRAIVWLYELQHRSTGALTDLLGDVAFGNIPTDGDDETWEPPQRLNQISLELHDVAGILANIDNKLRGLPAATLIEHKAA